MPRCISSTSPDDRSASRYLARRPSPLTVWPFEPLARNPSETASAGPAARASTRRSARPPSRAAGRGARFRLREARAWLTSGLRTLCSAIPRMRRGALWSPWRDARRHGHFGFREVPLGDKQALVDDVFHKVARRYDLMNDLMSAGLHRAWKDALVTALNPPRNERAFALLDVAGGTGDVAFRIDRRRAGRGTRVDRRRHQCRDARRRARARRRQGARRRRDLRRGQCRGAAVPGQELRRRIDRVRHPQRAAHRRGARRDATAC